MVLYVLAAGVSGIGLEAPVLQRPLPPPPGMIAEDYDYLSPRDLKSVMKPADPIDAQVQYAMVVVRRSGAAATVGQRFRDTRKIDDTAKILLAQEARTALHHLVRNGDIQIRRLEVTVYPPDSAEVEIDYLNRRARGKQERRFQTRVR